MLMIYNSGNATTLNLYSIDYDNYGIIIAMVMLMVMMLQKVMTVMIMTPIPMMMMKYWLQSVIFL